MSRYAPLGAMLRRSGLHHVEVTFREIGDLVCGLPPSSLRHRSWWGNDRYHVQARAWLDAGYQVDNLDFDAGTVLFRRA